MLALLSSSPVLMTKTFTANESWIAPVTSIESISGFGARGADGTYVQQYSQIGTRSSFRKDTGEYDVFTFQTATGIPGAKPDDYCEPSHPYPPDDPTYFFYQDCYAFTDTSGLQGSPTTGASATAFGKTFPGSTGSGAPAVTSFAGFAVTLGDPYPVVVPVGGSITITYYQ